MKQIRIKTPAKINLTLEILDKRPDGYHNIKSIMQAVDLFDYLDVSVEEAENTNITLNGTSDKIPYNEKNLVWKAAEKFITKTGLKKYTISVHIEKNIPVEAGLAGGSTNGAGMLFALNELFSKPLNHAEINELCAELGSDLNFCLSGGTALCTSRGEKIEKLPSPKLDVSLIKPLNFGISTKEAYNKFSMLKDKSVPNNSDKMADLLRQGKFDKTLLYNSFEKATLDDYPLLLKMKKQLKGSLMSGSGPTFFVLEKEANMPEDFIVINGLKTIPYGVKEVTSLSNISPQGCA